MYNRYVGNTGKVYRIEEFKPAQSDSQSARADETVTHANEPLKKEEAPKKHLLSGLLSGKLSVLDSKLPFGLETGDIVLLALFLFLFLESGDDEFLIILGFLAYSIIKDR